jgi:hypothetical protein
LQNKNKIRRMKNLWLALVILIMGACSTGKDNKENTGNMKMVFKNQTWQRFDNVNFTVPVTTKDTLDIKLRLTYNSKVFQERAFPMNVTMHTPCGEFRTRELRNLLINPGRQYHRLKGTTRNDTTIIMLPVTRKFSFHKEGDLKIEVENKNPKIDSKGIISLELVVKESK